MRRFGLGLFAFLSLLISGYSLYVYAFMPLGSIVTPEMRAVFVHHKLGIYTHVFASLLALALGPFQFWRRVQRHKSLHRTLGRLYLFMGVLPGGLSGLFMATHAQGGWLAQTGFAMLAVLWLFTAYQAYRSIRRGQVQAHQVWMIRNFALTFAAVTLRLYIPLSMVLGAEYLAAYRVIAWLCWVPNLLLVNWWLEHRIH